MKRIRKTFRSADGKRTYSKIAKAIRAAPVRAAVLPMQLFRLLNSKEDIFR